MLHLICNWVLNQGMLDISIICKWCIIFYSGILVYYIMYSICNVLLSDLDSQVFVGWVCLALVHSVVVFVLPYFSMTQDVAWGHGMVGGYLMVGNMVYTYVVVTVCLKAGLEMDAWTWVTHLAIWGSIASWFIFLLVYSNFWPILPMAADMCGIYLQVCKLPWLIKKYNV